MSPVRPIRAAAMLLALCWGVHAEQLLDLVHAKEIDFLSLSGRQLLSHDSWENWALWDLDAHRTVLRGKASSADFSAGVLVTNTSQVALLRRLPDTASTVLEIDVPGTVHLTEDGTVAYLKNANSLRMWNSSTLASASLVGAFSSATVGVDSARAYVAVKGADSILVYSVPTMQQLPPLRFSGTFACWLVPGRTFATSQGGVVREYASDGQQRRVLDIGQTADIQGHGDFVWTGTQARDYGMPVTIYEFGATQQPVRVISVPASSTPVASHGHIAIVRSGTDSIHVLEPGPDTTKDFWCRAQGVSLTAFTMDSTRSWAAGTGNGVVSSGRQSDPTLCLNHGEIRALTGSRVNHLAAATSSGRILTFDAVGTSSRLLDSVRENASALVLSADGSTLASLSDRLRVRRAGAVIWEWTLPPGPFSQPPYVRSFTLSDDGSLLSMVVAAMGTDGNWTDRATVVDILADSTVFEAQGPCSVAPLVSPTGRYIAVEKPDTVVRVYDGGRLTGAVSGRLGCWLPGDSLLVNKYRWVYYAGGSHTIPGWFASFDGAYAHTPDGDIDSSRRSPLPMMQPTAIARNEVFSGTDSGSICDLSVNASVFTTYNASRSSTAHGFRVCAPVGADHVVYHAATSLERTNWRLDKQSISRNSRHRAIHSSATVLRVSRVGDHTMLNIMSAGGRNAVLDVFDLSGQLVASRELGTLNAGRVQISIFLGRLGTMGGAVASTPLIFRLHGDSWTASTLSLEASGSRSQQ